ncbi:MAG TPA: periplasmic heavy metal sensor [Polyangiaceae bacterium]
MTPWTKRLAIALAISVGINLLFAGFSLGRHLGGPPPHPAGRAFGRMGPGEPRHPALRAALDRHRDELRDRRESIRKARMAAREALGRSDFDRAGLERALADLQTETRKSQELMHRAIVEAAATAEVEQRRALGRALGPSQRGPSPRSELAVP